MLAAWQPFDLVTARRSLARSRVINVIPIDSPGRWFANSPNSRNFRRRFRAAEAKEKKGETLDGSESERRRGKGREGGWKFARRLSTVAGAGNV